MSFATPAVFPKRSRTLPNAIMPCLSLMPCFSSSFARPEVVVASVKRALTPTVLSRCSCSLPCCIHAALSSMSSQFDIPSHVLSRVTHGARLCPLFGTARQDRSPPHNILQFEEVVFPRQATFFTGEIHIRTKSREQRRCFQPDGSATTWIMGTLPQHQKQIPSASCE